MKSIYSNVQKGLLLHIIHKFEEFSDGRKDIAPETEFLQVSALKLQEGKTFKPHKHNIDKKETTIAQESWVVLQGKVKAIFYDIDDQIIAEEILQKGDLSLTFRGGHNYLVLEDAIVYEFKTGPYYGQARDKTFI